MAIAPITSALKRTLLAAACLLSVGLWLTPALAAANGGVSQGFSTSSSNLTPGTIMGLKPGSKQTVVPAVSNQKYQLLGVVAGEPLIALSDGQNQVQINVSGPAEALVSDINGTIKTGDKIAASPITGVGMKATDAGQIVGIAQADLSASHPSQQTVTDKQGKSHTLEVGTIPIQVSVGYYAGAQNQGKLAAILPPSLLTLANNVAGEQVSALRVLISLFALVLGFIIAANMLQAGIRSGMVALGRNPLAKKALRRELLDICATAIGILVLTAIVMYLVLKL
jgi:hypothetical protein